jgi:hypothetical protein
MRPKVRIIPFKHRQNLDEIIRLHTSGQLGEEIPQHLQETIIYIRRNCRGMPEWYTLKQIQEDRHPKGTGYGEEEKRKKYGGKPP